MLTLARMRQATLQAFSYATKTKTTFKTTIHGKNSSLELCQMSTFANETSISKSYDAVIVGGGVIGSSIAYHLKKANPSVSVCVIERDSTYARASTPLSAGSIRQQFSIRGNIDMSLFSIDFLRNAATLLQTGPDDDLVPDIQLVEGGYLFLAGSSQGCQTLRENYELQIKAGADVILMEPEKLKAKFPWIVTDDISLACFGQSGEGWFDPWALLMGFRRKAISMGVDYLDTDCTGVKINQGKVQHVSTSDGELVRCGSLINAAGGWATELCAMAGIEQCPVRRRKRMIFLYHCPTGPFEDCPLVVDPSGVYFRREGSAGNFICGRSPHEANDPDTDDLSVDHEFFNSDIWPILAQRCEQFNALKQTASWAGFYEYNILDQNAIIGPHPEITNFLFANGFSGHGLQQAPAVGQVISEQVLYDKITSLDLSQFGFERVLENQPLREKNVV